MAENGAKRIRLGMVGGGTGAFIGYVHRIASRLDGDYDLVAGALSSRPEIAKESGKNLGLAEDRIDWVAEQSSGIARLIQNNPRPLNPQEMRFLVAAAHGGDRASLI